MQDNHKQTGIRKNSKDVLANVINSNVNSHISLPVPNQPNHDGHHMFVSGKDRVSRDVGGYEWKAEKGYGTSFNNQRVSAVQKYGQSRLTSK